VGAEGACALKVMTAAGAEVDVMTAEEDVVTVVVPAA
jgi:hypothetical protein